MNRSNRDLFIDIASATANFNNPSFLTIHIPTAAEQHQQKNKNQSKNNLNYDS